MTVHQHADVTRELELGQRAHGYEQDEQICCGALSDLEVYAYFAARS